MKTCPITGCGEKIQHNRLMCRRHWYLVPKRLRDAIWEGYENGLPPSYFENVNEAIRVVEDKIGTAAPAEAGERYT